jgi:serpin B
MNAFAFELLNSSLLAKGNLLFSPLSLTQALSMAVLGASGETRTEMQNVLRADPIAEPRQAFDLANTNEIELLVANKIWVQVGHRYRPQFLSKLREQFDSELGILDFTSRTEASRDTINSWIAQKTNGKISDLLKPGSLSSKSEMVLTNAVYFKGLWKQAFDSSLTGESDFHLAAGLRKSIPFLRSIGTMTYGETAEFQMMSKDYQGGEVAFVAIRPRAGSDAGAGVPLTLSAFGELMKSLGPANVHLKLPKFKTGSAIELQRVLGGMGMPRAFDQRQAEFQNIRDLAPDEVLALSSVVHESVIEVDEQGTVAAAATALAVVRVLGPARRKSVVLNFDVPFFYGIMNLKTKDLLFLGRMENP